jgi:hypothetical protein
MAKSSWIDRPGRIQVRYGVAKAEAEKQTDEWLRTLAESKHENHGAATRLLEMARLGRGMGNR